MDRCRQSACVGGLRLGKCRGVDETNQPMLHARRRRRPRRRPALFIHGTRHRRAQEQPAVSARHHVRGKGHVTARAALGEHQGVGRSVEAVRCAIQGDHGAAVFTHQQSAIRGEALHEQRQRPAVILRRIPIRRILRVNEAAFDDRLTAFRNTGRRWRKARGGDGLRRRFDLPGAGSEEQREGDEGEGSDRARVHVWSQTLPDVGKRFDPFLQ